MDVFDIIIDGHCVDCDLDPAECYNAGYCMYEESEEDDGDEII